MLTPRNFLGSENNAVNLPGSKKLLRIATIAALVLAEITSLTGCGRKVRNPGEFAPAEAPEVEAPAQTGTDEMPQIPQVPPVPSESPSAASTSPDGKKSCEELERKNAELTGQIKDLNAFKVRAMMMLAQCGDTKCMNKMMKEQGIHMTFDASPTSGSEVVF